MASKMEIDDKLNSSLDTLVKQSSDRPSRGGGSGRGRGRGEKRERNENGGVIRVARRIYVSNLTWRTSWQDLKDHFKQAGNVAYVDILREGRDGRSKGCGIVEFETAEEAAEAINTLHLSEIDGREIYVREDREDFDLKAASEGGQGGTGMAKRGRAAGGGGHTDGPISVGKRVYVNNLSHDTTWQILKDHFRQAGNVVHAAVLTYEDGQSKGCGIVEFQTSNDALRAISLLSNSTLDGNTIYVREDREDNAVRGRSPRGGERSGGGRGRGGGGDRDRGGGTADGTKIVVHGLPWSVEWQDLKDLAKQYGDAIKADIARRSDGKSRGFGTVVFKTAEDAQNAIQQLTGLEYEGRVLSAKVDEFV
ncbi:g4271 [Coccomyxa elongata]